MSLAKIFQTASTRWVFGFTGTVPQFGLSHHKILHLGVLFEMTSTDAETIAKKRVVRVRFYADLSAQIGGRKYEPTLGKINDITHWIFAKEIRLFCRDAFPRVFDMMHHGLHRDRACSFSFAGARSSFFSGFAVTACRHNENLPTSLTTSDLLSDGHLSLKLLKLIRAIDESLPRVEHTVSKGKNRLVDKEDYISLHQVERNASASPVVIYKRFSLSSNPCTPLI